MPVQENKSFAWTHKITIKNADGWLRSEQERIISRIMEIYPCNSFHFIEKYKSHCETLTTDAIIKVRRTFSLKSTAKISPPFFCGTINGVARIQPSISANAQIGFVIYGNGKIERDDEIEANGRISPIITASGFIDDRLHGTALVVYRRDKVICGNGRIVLGEHVLDDAQGNVKIGKQRGCDLKGDLPFTGWRLTRDGNIEHLIWYVRGVKQERWVQKVTQIEIWFNSVVGDTDGAKFLEAITNLMSYYVFGNRRVVYISDTKFSMAGDYTNQLFKGMKLQINSPDFCCKLFNDQMQELAYFKWLIENFPYQVALSKINSTNALKGNAKINGDLHEVTVVKSTFNGIDTVVEVSGEAIKDSDCLIMSWRERFDSIEVEKDYYPFSANARIQAFLRTTGKIFWLIGPPNLPGNEEDYAYKILDVGE